MEVEADGEEDTVAGWGKFINQGTENKTEEEPVVIFCSYLLQKPFRDNIFGSEKKLCSLCHGSKGNQTTNQLTNHSSLLLTYNIFELE